MRRLCKTLNMAQIMMWLNLYIFVKYDCLSELKDIY